MGICFMQPWPLQRPGNLFVPPRKMSDCEVSVCQVMF